MSTPRIVALDVPMAPPEIFSAKAWCVQAPDFEEKSVDLFAAPRGGIYAVIAKTRTVEQAKFAFSYVKYVASIARSTDIFDFATFPATASFESCNRSQTVTNKFFICRVAGQNKGWKRNPLSPQPTAVPLRMVQDGPKPLFIRTGA